MNRIQDMNPRERILALVLGTFVVGYLVWPSIKGFLITPIDERRATITNLESTVEDKRYEELLTTRDERRLRAWEARSLPPDPLDAQRAYLSWLTDLTTAVGLETTSVETQPPVAGGDVYSTLVVDIEGTTDFETLSRFLFHAQRVDLMHRIAKLDVVGTGSGREDPVDVHVVAEGLALRSAPSHAFLFPRTRLASRLEEDAEVAEVESVDGFPEQPGFEIRIDGEFARVVAIDESRWSLDRAVHRTRSADHGVGTLVELVPVSVAWRDRTLDSLDEFVRSNPFAKPRRYSPDVERIRDVVVSRGETAVTRLRAIGYDPLLGKPRFTLVETAEAGMQLDPDTGEFSWKPGETVDAGTYAVAVSALLPGRSDPIERTFNVVLREPNSPPRLRTEAALSALQGSDVRFTVEATDDDPDDRLRFSLRGAPDGAAIDATTGEFRWSVAEDAEPGTREIEVLVEDAAGASDSSTVRIAVLPNTAATTFLVGTINRDGDREAWLLDRKSGEKTVVLEGSSHEIAGVESFVLVIGRDFVLIQRGERTFRLDLGRSLEELREQEVDLDPQAG